ncbi:GIY-YIG nuclease family protein [Lutibacter sp.]|uniref:GIY-YIG nuclease family protein n=1 Tax=Lutibacter sp. TaxID=1925666 RepID=UPI0025BC723D|nr:GIY-YIG nuclease family protein [Lutibacter sp.]MCF6180685.1 GIY-YIG nuclease family protein [Lutibacter sp.]
MFYVYVLYSKKHNRKYTGMTIDIERRLKEHNTKQNKSTKAYAPWEVIFKEAFKTRLEAREREKYLKSGVGREFIKSLQLQEN